MSAWHRDHARHLGRHALVIGGSIAGLVTARVLSERFARVTVLDRDIFPPLGSNRRGVPQGWHGHGVLASGFQTMTRWFPALERELVEAGAVPGDVVGDLRWFQHGCYKARFDSGLRGILLSRPLLEGMMRRQIMALPNVTIIGNAHVLGFRADAACRSVIGVRAQVDRGRAVEVFEADLVVDASGRSTRSPEWLEEIGFDRPRLDEVKVGLGYTTRTFRRQPQDLDGALGAIIAPTPPRETRAGFILAMEGDRWVVSLCGWNGDHPQATAEGFLAFARSLSRPDVYDVVRRAVPLTDPVAFAFPANLRRRYEYLPRLPERFVAIGDAIASFNPIYGQGMSVAALEGAELEACLDEPEGLTWLGHRFFKRVAKVVDTPWTIAVGSDFAFDGVTGRRPAGTSLVNWYLDRVHDAASIDRRVCRAFFDVANLLARPTSLFTPLVVARVVRAHLGGLTHERPGQSPTREDETPRATLPLTLTPQPARMTGSIVGRRTGHIESRRTGP